MCVKDLRRRVPINYVVLLVFSISFAVVPTSCAIHYGYYNRSVIYLATLCTAGIAIAVTVYAFVANAKGMAFNLVHGALTVIGFSVFWFCFAGVIWGEWLPGLYCTLCVIAWGLYLLLDTWFILGKGHHAMEIDDYAYGAMMLYIDIFLIFVYLLRCLGRRN